MTTPSTGDLLSQVGHVESHRVCVGEGSVPAGGDASAPTPCPTCVGRARGDTP